MLKINLESFRLIKLYIYNPSIKRYKYLKVSRNFLKKNINQLLTKSILFEKNKLA